MRVIKIANLVLLVGLTVAASVRPGAAMVIYPWCANYGGAGKGGYGASSCGSTSLKQCLATLSGNGGTCNPKPWYQPSTQPIADTARY